MKMKPTEQTERLRPRYVYKIVVSGVYFGVSRRQKSVPAREFGSCRENLRNLKLAFTNEKTLK